MEHFSDRMIFKPGVALVGVTKFIHSGLEEAIELSGVTEVAEAFGTPLNDLTARVFARHDSEMIKGEGDDLAEFAGRQCYRSWGKGRPQSEYIANVIDECHGSIFRHANLVMQITGVSRSLTHELVRHGIGTAPSQESQRYVDAKDIRFVVPPVMLDSNGAFIAPHEAALFMGACESSLANYTAFQTTLKQRLGDMKAAGDFKGATSYQKRANEAARALLPNAAETRLLFSMNLQSIRHILSLRGTEFADLEIRRLAAKMLEKARDYAPEFFRHVVEEIGMDNLPVIVAKNGKL